ncbi:MAG: DUF177 domain-containing protein [Alistipes sp.]|nr:DUF177 domain-containing protein [Alistipes sp.]MDE7130159.1 DUF177 domain-containing protein [Alistipes sp.]
MSHTKPYAIAYKGLKEGDYDFEFEIGDALFESYGRVEILSGECRARVHMHRAEAVLEMHTSIDGSVLCECDRCLEECRIPVAFEGDLIVKFSDEIDDYDGEQMWISPGDDEVDLTQYLYESIVLSLPYRRVHAEGECNADMLARFGVMSAEEFDSRAEEAEQPESHGIGDEAMARLAELKGRMLSDDVSEGKA